MITAAADNRKSGILFRSGSTQSEQEFEPKSGSSSTFNRLQNLINSYYLKSNNNTIVRPQIVAVLKNVNLQIKCNN